MEKLYRKLRIAGMLLPLLAVLLPTATKAKINIPFSAVNTPIPLSYHKAVESKISVDSQDKSARDIGANTVSKSKAVLLTLLVPGAGHLYLGEKGRGEVFIGAEVFAWAGFFAYHTYANWKESDYIRFAREHAGIDSEGKEEEFYKNLTFYSSREEYNGFGRILNPGAPYYPGGSAYYWHWDSDASRAQYRHLRNSSKSADRNATFMIGAAVVNRIIAGIDVFRLAKRKAGRSTAEYGAENRTKLDFDINPFGRNPNVSMTISYRF